MHAQFDARIHLARTDFVNKKVFLKIRVACRLEVLRNRTPKKRELPMMNKTVFRQTVSGQPTPRQGGSPGKETAFCCAAAIHWHDPCWRLQILMKTICCQFSLPMQFTG